MTTYTRKAWAVMGWIYDGDTYCSECMTGEPSRYPATWANPEPERPHPVFVSDTDYRGLWHCRRCSAVIE
jgi:hypothetical protein